MPFVLATRGDDLLTCPDGRRHQAKTLAALAAQQAWERRSAAAGAHGERLYDQTVLGLDPAGLPHGWGHWLLVRRQIAPEPGKGPELAFYRCAGPAATPVPELIRVAGLLVPIRITEVFCAALILGFLWKLLVKPWIRNRRRPDTGC